MMASCINALTLYFSMVGEAFISLKGNRLRSFLAMLGIIIGVASVVAMLAVGNGSKRVIEQVINSLGTNQLVVTPGTSVNKGLRSADISNFTSRDVAAIAELPDVQMTAPATFPRSFPASNGKYNWDTPVSATTPDYLIIRNWQFTAGEAFTTQDVQNANRVLVLGATVAEKIFPDEDPLGRMISINKIAFRVVGVLARKGQSMEGRDQDNAVFMPMSTGKMYLWGNDNTNSIVQVIYIQVSERDRMDSVIEETTKLLRKRFNLLETEADNFNIHNLTAIKQVAADTNSAFTVLLQAIASISLLVGSIGIMNIMLVTVTERTREIGIRKAIGATEQQILFQFLLEAIMLSLVGSVLGLLLGISAGLLAHHWIGLPVEFSILSVVLSLVMAAGIGIASGLYPAYKAAKMQPIEALRNVGG
jgi:putative ABC transport system permease protein